MSIKPHYETYRYIGEVCRLRSQSIVECRLPGSEISGILAVYAKAIPADCVCADGEVTYNGKVLLSVVYEDGEKKICRAERGAEFFHKAEGNAVTPASFAKAALSVENVTYRREGSGLYISVIVDAALTVYGSKQIEYLLGGDGITVDRKPMTVCKTLCISGETEGEDEFETEYVGDILLHSETAVVNHVSAGAGQIHVEGELNLNICVLRSDESVCSYERLIPFQLQIPSDEAFGRITVGAKVNVKSAHLSAGTDEEKGKSKIVFSYCLSAECFLSMQEEFPVVNDAYSTLSELQLKKSNDGGRYLTKHVKCTERVSGVAALSPAIEGDYVLQASVLPRAEITCRKGERGMEAEGAVLAEVIMRGADGGYRSTSLSLPFLFPLEIDGDVAEVDCAVCGLNVRKKQSGETEAEATLKLCVRVYEERTWEYVSEVTEGEAYPENDSAFSVFIPRAGEDLWQVAKRLRCTPEELQNSNPELEFPLKEGKKLYIYRQIK
ncbi:MAG: DUF3794 domain-containing protein [Clostridia bacterium]|nr:DUF3794 domain-containing protein [Clostridia bacterium]